VAGAPTTAPILITGATVAPCDPQTGIDQGVALNNALDGLNTQACTSIGTNVSLDSITIGANPPGTFPPGCYSSSGSMDIALSTAVTLNGSGTYIFKSGGALTTGANSQVLLTGGATAANVFWAPVGATSLGAYTTGGIPPVAATFVGNILDAAGISLGHFAYLSGRALAFGGTVTTDANTITVPPPTTATLHVIKLVVNANGGSAVAADFSVHVKSAGVDVSGSPTVGTLAPGTAYTLAPGTYAVSENTNTAYVQSFFGTDCDSSGNVTLLAGADKICTVVNTDIPPPAPAAPASGGSSSGGQVIPLIGLLKIPTPLALPAGAGPVTYDYTVWNLGGLAALSNVTITDDKCTPSGLLSGDTNGNGQLDSGENWKYRCTTTLSRTTTNTAVATGQAFGQTAVATALATVIVGPGLPNAGLLPPIINVVKVPSRLVPFPIGGGSVNYSYTVTNPGVVAMSDVSVTDDKCFLVIRRSGDGNGNNLLDPGEAWLYTCQANINVSTMNIATARGTANGFTALGYSIATVLVGTPVTPGFPNTGLEPGGNDFAWSLDSGIHSVLVRLLEILKGQIKFK